MSKDEKVTIMIDEVLKIESDEKKEKYRTANEMKKDAVKRILNKLEEVMKNENQIDNI